MLSWRKTVVVLSASMLAAAVAASPQTYTVIHLFGYGADGGNPHAPLTIDSGGNLYGTTFFWGDLSESCGSYGCGVAFKLSPTGKETILYSFTGGSDGGNPEAPLILAGGLYGAAAGGGTYGGGVVFKLSSVGNEAPLYTFTGGLDGAAPVGTLTLDSSGNIYGTAGNGGNYTGVCNTYGCGVIFKLDPAGNETVLYRFTGGSDGGVPTGGVVRDSAGNLYGVSNEGGSSGTGCGGFGCGVVFEIDPSGNESVLYNFTGGADGGSPNGGLIRDAFGNLYGTTVEGGNNCQGFYYGCGVVFEVSPTGSEKVLYSFGGGTDGGGPNGSLVADSSRNLYGTTVYGGSGNGVVFKLSPKGQETVLHSFAGGNDGAVPLTGLLLNKGELYGTTFYGGKSPGCFPEGCGVAFKVSTQ